MRAIIVYIVARFKKDQEEFYYRAYMTNSLQAIAENTAKALRGGGRVMTKSWTDLINHKPVETRNGDEIAADVIARCGLKVTK